MADLETLLLAADTAGVARAAKLLRQGQLVAFPTETVYGLGADAGDDQAVARVFSAKGRPQSNPLIVHVANAEAARKIASFGQLADRLADAFWPGPLTLVLPLKDDARISALVAANLPAVAIRVPEHSLAQELLAEFAGPIAAPSANPSGKVSPTRAEHVMAGLGGRIAAVMDGGVCDVGVESTIVGCSEVATLLRPGGLPAEAIEQCLGRPLAMPTGMATPNAPGQLQSHYAPDASLRMNAERRETGETLLGFGPVECDLNLSPSGDLAEAAENLFHYLRELDSPPTAKIAVLPIPNHGLGRAINDRLQKAAAPRA
jgi:L-threonylcarbamoyladenylate synthase